MKNRFKLSYSKIIKFLKKGDFVWLQPKEKNDYDLAIGGRIYNSNSTQIQIIDDEEKVKSNLDLNKRILSNVIYLIRNIRYHRA